MIDLIRLAEFIVKHGYEENDREYNGQCLGCMAHPADSSDKKVKHKPNCAVGLSERILKRKK